MAEDDKGIPMLFAIRAPGQVAAQRDPSGIIVNRGAASGNPNADKATGRFTSAGGKNSEGDNAIVMPAPSGLPQGVTQEQWDKRRDLVRDAARELDDMDLGDAKEWLEGKVADMSAVNVDQFLIDVRAQRLDDLVDILDYQLRNTVQKAKRARRFVRIAAPRGFQKRVFAGLDDDEVLHLVKRLEGRGWDPKDLKDNVVNKISNEERRKKLEQLYGEGKEKT